MQSFKGRFVWAGVLAFALFQASVAWAQQVATAAPAAPPSPVPSAAPVSALAPQMDRREAKAILQRDKTAKILSYGGLAVGATLVFVGGGIVETKGKECDKMPDEDRAKLECRRDALKMGLPVAAVGGVALIGALVSYVFVRPSREARSAARRAMLSDVQFHVDPAQGAYAASFRAAF
jgi:hypothetical protein